MNILGNESTWNVMHCEAGVPRFDGLDALDVHSSLGLRSDVNKQKPSHDLCTIRLNRP
jgi:hypothetical protein